MYLSLHLLFIPMIVLVSLLQQCFDRSFFILESASRAVSQSDLNGISTLADESVFTTWHFEGDFLGNTFGHDRLVWDFMHDGPAV